MFQVHDSRDVIFEQFRMEGGDSTVPSFGIECVAVGGDGAGTNGYMSFRDLHIGRYPWTSQGTNKGIVKSGIGFTGHNTNNDESYFDRIRINYPQEYGLYLPNTQSLGCQVNSLSVSGAGIAAVSTGAEINMSNLNFYGNAIDIQVTGDNAVVAVNGIHSESTYQFAELHRGCVFVVRNGVIQVQNVIAGAGVFIDAFPTDQLILHLQDVLLTNNTDPTLARIEFGPLSPSYVGRFMIHIDQCGGMAPTQLVFAPGASMWATSPMSKGIVEWKSRYVNSLYQFRNELRKSGSGTRTTLNYAAWDAPVTD